MSSQNVRSSFSWLYLWPFLLTCFAFPVSAQTEITASADAAFGRFMTNVVGGAQQTVSFGTGGQAVISSASGNLAYSAAGTTTIAGQSVPVTVTGAPAKAALGKAMVASFKAFAGPLMLGVALFDLAREIGVLVTRKPDGTLDVIEERKTFTCAGSCVEYQNEFTGVWYPSLSAVCTSLVGNAAIESATPGADPAKPASFAACTVVTPWWASGTYTRQVLKKYNPMVEGVTQAPITEQELADKIASQSGWPSTSAMPRAVKQALEMGQAVPVEETTKTITGPASTQPKETVTKNPDGTTTTKTEKANITYEGNKITITNTSSVVNSNPVTNTSTTTTTTTQNAPNETPQTDCEKFPDSIGCAKFGDIPEADKIKKTTHALDITAKAFNGSAACPAPVQVNAMGQTYDISYDPLCDKLALIKPLMLLFAAFLAAYVLADSFKV